VPFSFCSDQIHDRFLADNPALPMTDVGRFLQNAAGYGMTQPGSRSTQEQTSWTFEDSIAPASVNWQDGGAIVEGRPSRPEAGRARVDLLSPKAVLQRQDFIVQVMNRHCCDWMQAQIDKQCDVHSSQADCPDALIAYHKKDDQYGIRIHDGGTSWIGISYCPWCGTSLQARALSDD